MADKRRRTPDVASLTPHDQRMVQEPRSEWTLTVRPPISLAEMTSGIVPWRKGVKESAEIKALWGTLAQAPLSVVSASKSGSEGQDTIMVGRGMNPEEVNALLYFAAPYKGFLFDTSDIINDWTALYTEAYHENRRKAHALMPGWAQFEDSKDRVLGVLKRNYKNWDFTSQDRRDVIYPVLRWRKDAEGNNSIVLDPLEEGLQVALAQTLPDQVKDRTRLDSGMGLMYLAAYSPWNTDWLDHDGYQHSNSSSTNTIGPTQVLAYGIREVARKQAGLYNTPQDQDLQASMWLDVLGQYAQTGDRPAITIQGDTVDSLFPPTPANPYVARVPAIPSQGNQDILVNVGTFAGATTVPLGKFNSSETTITDAGYFTENSGYSGYGYEEKPLITSSKLIKNEEIPLELGQEVTIVDFTTPTNNIKKSSGKPKIKISEENKKFPPSIINISNIKI